MGTLKEVIEECRVKPDTKVRLKDFDPDWVGERHISKEERQELTDKWLTGSVQELDAAQELLYASDTWALLVIFQAMDAAGKDGTIKHVMSGVNPQGCQVFSFKRPSMEELDHDFLWRYNKALPERGRIGIFNRSYYEDVLVVKVHPELVESQHIPDADPSNKEFWNARYEGINAFEKHLTQNGTRIVKFFLNVSKDEQRKRFLERLNDPDKHWKFSSADLKERVYWDQYQEAFEDAISATSTKHAPWYIVPADRKWACHAIVATILARTISELNLKNPKPSPEMSDELAAAKKQLEEEK